MAISFNTEFYLEQKLAQLQADGETSFETTADVAAAFEASGLTAEEHYEQFGLVEGLNPNEEFDTNVYLSQKLAQLQASGEEFATVEEVIAAFAAAGLSPLEHYNQFGAAEALSPNANFNVQAYLEDKLAQLQADGVEGFETTADVLAAFQTAGLTPLDHFKQFGEAEGLVAKPLPTDGSALTEALVALQNAQTAEAEALADIALAVNAALDTPLTGDALDAYVAGFTANDATVNLTTAETAVGTAQAALLNAQSTLTTARNLIEADPATVTGDYLDGVRQTDANLQVALNEVRADIQADDVARPLLNTRTEAQAALNNDIGVEGSNRQILTDLRTAITAYANAGGDLAAVLNGTTSVAELLAEINTALAVENDDGVAVNTLVGTFEAANYELAGTTAEVTAINEAIVVVEERDALVEALATAQTNLEGNALGADLVAVEALIATRDGLKEAVTAAESDLAEAQQYFDQLSELVATFEAAGETTEAAREALEALGVENLVELGVTSTSGTAEEADLYLFSAEETGDLSLLNFEAADLLFIGEGYSRVDLGSDADIAAERLGSSAELEVFFQQDGINAVIYIETEAFGGNAIGEADLTKITLTGVSIDDLQFENGYVSIVEAA